MTKETNSTEVRNHLMRAYDGDLAVSVGVLIDSLPQLRHESAMLVGSGRSKLVFPLEHQGNELVVKLFHDNRFNVDDQINDAAEVSLATRDLVHLEKITAASVDDKAIVAERAAGTSLDNLENDAFNQITDEQIAEFLEDAIIAIDRGITFDPSPSNLIYDREKGFVAIDLSIKSSDVPPGIALAGLFNSSGVDFRHLDQGIVSSSLGQANCRSALHLLERVKAIAINLPGVDGDFLRKITQDIKANQEALDMITRKKSSFLKRLVKR